MKCYRIMSESYYKSPYGSSSNAGRWNPKGTRMIYAGSAPTVALLEYLCIKGPAAGKKPWYMITFTIDDESLVGTLDVRSLPADWSVIPHGKATQDFGKSWLDERESPFLKVPSARVHLSFYPMEFNLLINPDFPGLSSLLKVTDMIPFTYLLNPWITETGKS
jgi:RES domain-containing protein